jgi:4-hydroxythreonine-4-phosphate dehydrogenase
MQNAGFNYPGHTEYLGEKLGGKPLMLLCADKLRVAVVSGHVAIKDVAESITEQHVFLKIEQLNNSLIKDFGIRKPKIAVLGLNPHAGENGKIGNEEEIAISPAIKKAQETMFVQGPYPADGFFGNNTQTQFDGILAMYHDQGLIPFKTLAFNSGVNFTAGLNYIRTSPDHGTAYEIVGKNLADATSFRESIYTAIDIFKNRKLYTEISSNPLISNPTKKERS